jgi:hypothetical protein
MGAVAIREKLQDYIRNADDKKVKAIYTMVENDIEFNYRWWKDEALVNELADDIKAIKAKKQRTYTLEAVQAKINRRRKKII